MLLPPFDKNLPFFRGNLHGHSTHSDGLASPQKVAAGYRDLGYDFIAISDHLWKKTWFSAETVYDGRGLDRSDFITIPSAELHCYGKAYDQDGIFHIVANGLPLDFPPAADDEDVSALVARAIQAGAYVTIAHPEWCSLTHKESLAIAHAHAVEIYNHSCVIYNGRGSGIGTADRLLHEGFKVNLTASDDSHFRGYDIGGGWVHVAAVSLDAASIVAALKAGQYYSSTGAVFSSLWFDDGILHVHCKETQSIIVSGYGHLALSVVGDGLTHAEFDLTDFPSNYFRVTLRDKNGQTAWSNPYFLNA